MSQPPSPQRHHSIRQRSLYLSILTLASELLPPELSLDGLQFKLGPSAPGALNVLVPKG